MKAFQPSRVQDGGFRLPACAIRGALLLAMAVWLAGCGRGSERREAAYVSASQANLRDRLAAVYNKTGVVKNAERVEVLERSRRFVRVRTARNEEGWIEQRYLVDQKVFDGFQKLAAENRAVPPQAEATARNDLNLHLQSDRDAEHLYQLHQGEKLFVLKRATAERPPSAGGARSPSGKEGAATPVLEDWWLAHDSQGHVGWVLARIVDIDAPLEIAQYAEGQRIVGYFVLNQVPDGDQQVAQYLVLLTEPKDGLPFDYNQIRVFTWNVKRHRYETAYRERRLQGMFPVTVGREDLPPEGNLPVFVLRVADTAGKPVELKYKLNGPIVRRVLAPGEPKRTPARAPSRRASRRR